RRIGRTVKGDGGHLREGADVATAGVKGSQPWALRKPELVAAGLLIGALVGSYAPNFVSLFNQWNRDPNYSYGFFVIPIALMILWTRRGMLDRSKLAPSWWGFIPLVGVLALRYPLYEWNELYVETATIPLALAAMTLAVGGWHLLRVCWPSLVFLFFMLPLPPSLNQFLAAPL